MKELKKNKIKRPLARLTKKKREDPNKQENQRREITVDTTAIQKPTKQTNKNENPMDKYISTNWKSRRNGQISRNT